LPPPVYGCDGTLPVPVSFLLRNPSHSISAGTSHPHVSGNCTRSGSGAVESEVVGVHNSIVENYTELKEKLLKHGYTFYSQTDTEVVVKLVDYYNKKYNLGVIGYGKRNTGTI
jgi:glucosamine--fructose-6-phosphate aminotransferase (isomerizing)